MINVNLKSAFNFIKAVLPVMMKQRSGSIINMASVVGVHGNACLCGQNPQPPASPLPVSARNQLRSTLVQGCDWELMREPEQAQSEPPSRRVRFATSLDFIMDGLAVRKM